MGDWQPIETAPKDGTRVDLLVPRFVCEAIEAALLAARADERERAADQDTSGKLVYCVLCLNSPDPGDETHHIFSSMEKAEAWAATDDRPHIISDYVIDVPERKELRNT